MIIAAVQGPTSFVTCWLHYHGVVVQLDAIVQHVTRCEMWGYFAV